MGEQLGIVLKVGPDEGALLGLDDSSELGSALGS